MRPVLNTRFPVRHFYRGVAGVGGLEGATDSTDEENLGWDCLLVAAS